MLKKILPLFLILIFLSVSGFGCRNPQEKKEITIVFWNLWDDSSQWKDLIENYEKTHPNIKIRYYKKSYQEYEQELINALAAGKGPDIFVINNSWLPRYLDKIRPISPDLITESKKLITEREFEETFVDVAYRDFVVNGEIYAIPFSVDTLALYYNKDLLNTVGIPEPPKTWEELGKALHAVKAAGLKSKAGKTVHPIALDLTTLFFVQNTYVPMLRAFRGSVVDDEGHLEL